MFLVDGEVAWSASDLTNAASCEYQTLKELDYLRNRATRPKRESDTFLDRIAQLGLAHEARVLDEYRKQGRVKPMPYPRPPYTREALDTINSRTLTALGGGADVLYQGALWDGEILGIADFLENTPDGWLVADAKLARSAKTTALLQLAAYAYLLAQQGQPVAPSVALNLGDKTRAEFPTSDLLPVFLDRQERMRELVEFHKGLQAPVAWGEEFAHACGTCDECVEAATANNDLLLVANIRADQRRKLHSIGVRTVEQLAHATIRPADLPEASFERLRQQAKLQWEQSQREDGKVLFELTPTAPDTLARLPNPSDGDLFFDFEGDPLFTEADGTPSSLEYLWGVLDTQGVFEPLWAHDGTEEKEALTQFLDLVKDRWDTYPDMHVYHYAPYEVTALKRLVRKYQVHEDTLDDLLRARVFVDLYETVRGAVRVGQPSYSIKMLEPLYMPARKQDDDSVGDGAASVVAYHEYREWLETNPEKAQQRLAELEKYNEYDCISTLELRDWLLEQAEEAGIQTGTVAGSLNEEERAEKEKWEREREEKNKDRIATFNKLLEKAGPPDDRDAETRAYAMLAAALWYFRREDLQFWWEHFDRLKNHVDLWAEDRDVFTVKSGTVDSDWEKPPRAKTNLVRTATLEGEWSAGSTPTNKAVSVYAAFDDSQNLYDVGPTVSKVVFDPANPNRVTITESANPENVLIHKRPRADFPAALVPASPPPTKGLADAVLKVGKQTSTADSLPFGAALDLLAHRPPRVRGDLPQDGEPVENLVAALTAMDDSYVAVQGPPGTGKTYVGARVIKDLVEKHHWKVGVVAQSHAVVENMLDGIAEAGLDPSKIAKEASKKDSTGARQWISISRNRLASFVASHPDGCVVGGTAWDFVNEGRVPRGSLDLLVVDEAGQFALAPTLAASVAAKRLLLLGDPGQLPQVSQGAHPEPVNDSALGWLMGDARVLPAEYGYFLEETYRMPKALADEVSTLSYNGQLKTAEKAAERKLAGTLPGVRVILVPHTGNRVDSVEEAKQVAAEIENLIGFEWLDPKTGEKRPLTEDDFLVVAPYNAQVNLIQNHLENAGLGDVRVGTVDKFQGQEAPVAIMSMTASSKDDVPRGLDFVLNRNRVNVAISRAQWQAIVVRSPSLTRFWPSSVETLLDLGAFLGLGTSTERMGSARVDTRP